MRSFVKNGELSIIYPGYEDISGQVRESILYVSQDTNTSYIIGNIYNDTEKIKCKSGNETDYKSENLIHTLTIQGAIFKPEILKELQLNMAQILQNLNELNLEQCLSLTDDDFTCIFKTETNYRHLKKLNISQNKISDTNLQQISENLSLQCFLEQLFLSFCRNISDQGIGILVEKLQKLEVLEVKATNITDRFFQYLTRKQGLKRLNLCKCTQITGEGLQSFLTTTNKLEYLDISCTKIDDTGARAIKNVEKSIVKLKMYECDYISCQGFEDLFDYSILNDQPQELIQSNQNREISDQKQQKLFQNLKELDVSWTSFSEKAFELLLQNDVKLKELCIPRCKLLNGNSLLLLLKNQTMAKELQILDIGFNQKAFEQVQLEIWEALIELRNMKEKQGKNNKISFNIENIQAYELELSYEIIRSKFQYLHDLKGFQDIKQHFLTANIQLLI